MAAPTPNSVPEPPKPAPPRPPKLTPAPPKVTPTPKPSPKPTAKPVPRPTPTEREPSRDEAREQAAKRAQAEKREAARKAADDARNAREKARTSRETGSGERRASSTKASGVDLAAYASTIYAEIARHKDASGIPASGSVGVIFTVGASGRVVSHSITKSSGEASLDSRVHAMMQAVQAPPPPGGSFTGHITIRFSGSE
jgi:TonB family protein